MKTIYQPLKTDGVENSHHLNTYKSLVIELKRATFILDFYLISRFSSLNKLPERVCNENKRRRM